MMQMCIMKFKRFSIIWLTGVFATFRKASKTPVTEKSRNWGNPHPAPAQTVCCLKLNGKGGVPFDLHDVTRVCVRMIQQLVN